ncbi:uncharacterized protein LOC114244205 [Bombyx mandarina]|uniref:Uncharacterized protein LOC114244205 n=1 Tax=Bombyx mandarina TaxID=7092 RepID=A0A6J2JPW0_BOMMA|nr:uncharacterized protein LOC114244205 [Bombyx mandarina]
MEPHQESSSLISSNTLECNGAKDIKGKGSPVQGSDNTNLENMFTSTPNQSSSLLSLNGPRSKQTNCLSYNEVVSSNSLAESNAESSKTVCTNQSNVKMNSCNDKDVISSKKVYDNGVELNQDVLSCQKHKICQDLAANSPNVPSTSGINRVNEPDSNCRESRKRPSSLKLNRPNFDADDSSSDTGNDDYSLGSEDGCIYTYRGGEHLADLPSSFFSLDMGLPLDNHLPLPPNYPVPQQGQREQGSRASSPDMDFLEMDFDPGPSCEMDTGDESIPDAEIEAASNMPEENEPVMMSPSPENVSAPRANSVNLPSASSHNDLEAYSHDIPSTSNDNTGQGDVVESTILYGPYIMQSNARGEELLVRRTMSLWPTSGLACHHATTGDLVCLSEMLNSDEEEYPDGILYEYHKGHSRRVDPNNLSSVYHLKIAKNSTGEKTKPDSDSHIPTKENDTTEQATTSSNVCAELPRCMVWSEREACERQVTQIGTSACGATAVINVFIALGVPVNIEKITSAVGTRLRANNAPIPRYILSRAVAGCTAADLITGIQRASDGLVTARFFPTYPERAVSLSHWLADWISLGAIPILTLNLQMGCQGDLPDAWHHQMVFGVSPRGVYLCNPVECVREHVLWARLVSPSVLLVRSRDILSRYTPDTDLTPLMFVPDRRFHTYNVFGQVVNLIREWRAAGWVERSTRTRHVRVPASYQAGVTVAALTGSEAHRRLNAARQLPVITPQNDPE